MSINQFPIDAFLVIFVPIVVTQSRIWFVVSYDHAQICAFWLTPAKTAKWRAEAEAALAKAPK